MNKFVYLLLLLSTSTFAAGGTFIFTAPTSPVTNTPLMTNLASVVTLTKNVGTAFSMTDPAVGAALDQAATNLTLSITIAQIDTANVNQPSYSNGVMSWTNNINDSLSSANNWYQTNTATYDAAASSFRDAVGTYATASMMEGAGGFNRLLASIDGVTRTVNGAQYTPVTNYNSIIEAFNTAVTVEDKISQLDAAALALAAIQAQAAAISTAGDATVSFMNNTILPEAGRGSSTFANLDALLVYHSLQVVNP